MVTPPAEFTQEAIGRLFRKIFQEHVGEATILDFFVYPDRDSALSNCKCQTDMNYTAWRRQFEDLRDHVPAVAELTVIGRSATMRFRDHSGKIARTVLDGADPLLVKANACSGEILYTHPTQGRRKPKPDETGIVFFVRSQGAATMSCAKALTNTLAERLNVKNIILFLRSDVWFISEDYFPIIYPFELLSVPPPTLRTTDLQRPDVSWTPHRSIAGEQRRNDRRVALFPVRRGAAGDRPGSG
jgi:hypothetical protein